MHKGNINTDDKLLIEIVKVSAAAYNYSIQATRRYLHWLIDSDCGVHMTSDRSLFDTYEKWSGGAAQVGDGDKLRATGRGRLKPIIIRNSTTGAAVIHGCNRGGKPCENKPDTTRMGEVVHLRDTGMPCDSTA